MATKDFEAKLAEVRAVHNRMEDLQKAAAAADSAVASKERALEKAQERLSEAKEAAKQAHAAVSAFIPEQNKATKTLMQMIARDPSLGHNLLGAALNLAPEPEKKSASSAKSGAKAPEAKAASKEDKAEGGDTASSASSNQSGDGVAAAETAGAEA